MNLDLIVDRLHKEGQRATYGALAAILGRPAIGVMQGRPKDRRNSWVVAKKSGLPTGYDTGEIDPRLANSPRPIDTPDALMAWLRANP